MRHRMIMAFLALAFLVAPPVSAQTSAGSVGGAADLAVSTSADFASACSDETGSGLLVFATSPTFSGLPRCSVTAGITASATQTQGQQALTTAISQVSVVATDGDVVTLPAAVAGIEVAILNDGANTLQIFPASGDDLGNGVDASVELEANEAISFVAYDSVNWDTKAETASLHAEMEDSNNADQFVVTAASNPEAYHSNGIVAGDLAGFTFDIGGGGATFPIASIADAGDGDITVTTTGSHTLEVGAIISHAGLADVAYEGIFQVLTVPLATTYTVTAVYTATDTGTMQEASTLTANPIAAGAYFFSWSMSATSATNNETFDFQLYANAAAAGPPTRRKFGTGGDFGSFSGSGIIVVAAGDKVSLVVTNNDSAADITIRNLSLSLIRL